MDDKGTPPGEPSWEMISQGAEARVYATTFFGQQVVVKERFVKQYRHPELDKKLTYQRLRSEVRSLVRAVRAGVPAPAVLHVDKAKLRIVLERIDGITAKSFFNDTAREQTDTSAMAKSIGATIARLHNAGMVHGDLTTSNILLRWSAGESGAATTGSAGDTAEIVLIDFGLSASQASVEDKGVDLYVLERAFSSTHRNAEILFSHVLEAYMSACKDSKTVRTKYAQVQARGRKRLAFG